MRFIKLLLVVVLVSCITYLGNHLYQSTVSTNEMDSVGDIVRKGKGETAVSAENDTNVEFTVDSFNELKAINDDFVGYIFWNHDYTLPVVQTTANGDYLRTSFYCRPSSQGTPYMDCNNSLGDTNISIYGHNVFYDQNAMFSPVASMVHQNNFEKYAHFYMCREDGIHEYNAVYVYYLTEEEHATHYAVQPNFQTQEEFEQWIDFAKERILITSPENVSYGDRLLTLYTCKAWDDETKIIVHAHEVSYILW